jgi:hypothetical protein
VTRALLLLSCSCLAMAQSPADWRFAQPDADIKASVNLQTLLKSDPVAKAIDQVKAQYKDNAAQIDLVLAMLRTVDRVSVSGIQKGPNDVDALAEVTGTFDPQLVTGFFPSTGSAKVKVVGPHTILIGEGDSFNAAVDRMGGSGPAAVAADDLANSDIWIEAGANFMAKQSGQTLPPMFQDLRDVALGLTFSDSPVFDMVLTSSSEDGAQKLLGTLNILNSAAAGSPQAAGLAKNLKLVQDGAKIKMHLVIPPEAVAMIQEQAKAAASGGNVPPQLAPLLGMLGLGGASAAGTHPAVGASAPPRPNGAIAPAPQNGGTIKIYGLDDGTKEIPATK